MSSKTAINFTQKQMEAIKAVRTEEELIALVKGEGFNLTQEQSKALFRQQKQGVLADEEMENVAGGTSGGNLFPTEPCPKCPGEGEVYGMAFRYNEETSLWRLHLGLKCLKCGQTFEVIK